MSSRFFLNIKNVKSLVVPLLNMKNDCKRSKGKSIWVKELGKVHLFLIQNTNITFPNEYYKMKPLFDICSNNSGMNAYFKYKCFFYWFTFFLTLSKLENYLCRKVKNRQRYISLNNLNYFREVLE